MPENNLGRTTAHVAAIVRDLRKQKRISTTAMAALLVAQGRQISQSGVVRLETGQRRIDVDDLAALAAALGVAPARLLPPVGPHTHHGPRIGATQAETFLYRCELCGITFPEGYEEFSAADVADVLEAINPLATEGD
jgi:transcriptional regulator with XRE-family HTH domain